MLYSLTRVPQLGQNTVSALILAWQLGQTTASGSATSALVPQVGQNEAPCGMEAPQFGQVSPVEGGAST